LSLCFAGMMSRRTRSPAVEPHNLSRYPASEKRTSRKQANVRTCSVQGEAELPAACSGWYWRASTKPGCFTDLAHGNVGPGHRRLLDLSWRLVEKDCRCPSHGTHRVPSGHPRPARREQRPRRGAPDDPGCPLR
jgi:hypothetical protein